MPRRQTAGTAGLVFHVLNRGVRRSRIFDSPGDYRAFLGVMREAHDRVPIRILAYCLMPNHFHLVLWPQNDRQMSDFMHWLTGTHSKRWHVWRGSAGTGHLYQGRFKSIPVQTDGHFLSLCRYVERNALRAHLVPRAEDWPWGSLAQRCRKRNTVPLDEWPIPQPTDWVSIVNGDESVEEVSQIREAVRRSLPFGGELWRPEVAARLGLELEPGRSGRPRKKTMPGVGFLAYLWS